MVKIKAKPTNIYIIQVYFPTSRRMNEEIKEAYEMIEELMELTECNTNMFIMGDFNAIIGFEGSNFSEKFELWKRNERGTRLLVL